MKATIRNFKSHLLSVLAGTALDFSTSLWDRIIPQAEITINLLQQSNETPNVSAYAHLSGPFDYNKMPLSPMGLSVKVHEKTDKRSTWAYHSVDGWYLATLLEHYRTHRRHIKTTSNEKFKDTVHFSHKKIKRPTITHVDKVMTEIANCAKFINNLVNCNGYYKMQQLVRIKIDKSTTNHPFASTPNPIEYDPEILRVPLNNTNNKSRQTRSMTHPTK